MENKSNEVKRKFGLDIARFLAIFLVIMVHSMLHDGFYQTSIEGGKMFFLLFLRNTGFLCVPLFLLLTGYLNTNAGITKKYYSKIKKLVLAYLLISIIVIIFKYFYFENHDIVGMIIGITNYSTIDYAWYFEMYVGLFLLIPFLNILYKNISSKKEKQWLIITMLLVTSVGDILSSLKIEEYRIAIMPNYWNIVFPITYYFIGAYLNEYKIKINKYINLIALVFVLFVQTFMMFYYCHGYTFVDKISIGYNNLFTIIESTLLFLLVYDIERRIKIISPSISKISKVSFNMYLLSIIFDFVVYREVTKHFTGINSLFIVPLISVPIVFILSFISAIIVDFIVRLLTKKKA